MNFGMIFLGYFIDNGPSCTSKFPMIYIICYIYNIVFSYSTFALNKKEANQFHFHRGHSNVLYPYIFIKSKKKKKKSMSHLVYFFMATGNTYHSARCS